MKHAMDSKKMHPVSSNSDNFDKSWKATFEELGRKDLPAYRKASYETGKYAFSQREMFLDHLIRSLLPNMDSLEIKSPICLDLGCNIGLYTQVLHQYGFNVCGIDYAEPLIKEAKMAYPNITFLSADAYHVPFKDNSFDAVLSFGLFPCVSDTKQVLMEMLRLLRPGGIGIVETNRDFKFPILQKVIRHFMGLIRGEMAFPEIFGKLKTRLERSPASSTNYAPLRQNIGLITGLLINLDAGEIIVHDPKRFMAFHFSFWGLSFKKKNKEIISAGSTSVTYCPLCLNFGKWKL